MTLHAKSFVCRSNRLTCGQTKTMRKKIREKKLEKNESYEKRKKTVSQSHKEHIFKKLGSWVENCDLYLDLRHKDIHTPK